MARPLLYQSNSFQAETAGPAAPLPGRDMASTIPLPSVRGVLNMAYIEAVSGVDSSMGRAPCSDTGVAGSIPAPNGGNPTGPTIRSPYKKARGKRLPLPSPDGDKAVQGHRAAPRSRSMWRATRRAGPAVRGYRHGQTKHPPAATCFTPRKTWCEAESPVGASMTPMAQATLRPQGVSAAASRRPAPSAHGEPFRDTGGIAGGEKAGVP